jgi:hypothetical protein
VIVNLCEYVIEREKEKENKKEKKEKEEQAGTTETGGLTDGARIAFVPGIHPGTNVIPHLYRIVCTGWIPSINEGFQPVQMSVSLVI